MEDNKAYMLFFDSSEDQVSREVYIQRATKLLAKGADPDMVASLLYKAGWDGRGSCNSSQNTNSKECGSTDTVNPFTKLKQLEGEIVAHYVATAFKAVHEGECELYAALRALSDINKVNLFPYINGNLFEKWRSGDSFTPAAVSILRDRAIEYLEP